jgi:hypothetical protein
MMAIEQKFVLTVVSTRIGPIRQLGHGDMYRKVLGDANLLSSATAKIFSACVAAVNTLQTSTFPLLFRISFFLFFLFSQYYIGGHH